MQSDSKYFLALESSTLGTLGTLYYMLHATTIMYERGYGSDKVYQCMSQIQKRAGK